MRLYGKNGLKERLDDIAAQGRLSHAVLFSGHSGVGKKTLAKYTAELFMCKNGACGACPVCRNIENGVHPDVIFVKEGCGGKYTMDALREVLSGTVIRPNNGSIKLYVFEDCDTMRPEHQNSLLKLIEEPAEYLRFVFTCENTSIIPETVLSRVTEFEVPDTPVEECERALVDCGVDKPRARELSEMFVGNIGKCKAVIEGGEEPKLIETARKARRLRLGRGSLGADGQSGVFTRYGVSYADDPRCSRRKMRWRSGVLRQKGVPKDRGQLFRERAPEYIGHGVRACEK